MVVFLFRPSPQVPKPSIRSAILCFDASAFNIKLQSTQMERAMGDITWIFLLSLYMAINTILWSISYPEVRLLHSKEELEELIELALDIIVKCRERWPGTQPAHLLYQKLAKACLRSYESNETPSSFSDNYSPSSLTDANSPSASEHSSSTTASQIQPQQAFQSSPPPQFGFVFDQMPETISPFDYNNGGALQPAQPAFRSNSIFGSPSSNMPSDRRFSYFPPDFTQDQPFAAAWNNAASSEAQHEPSALAPAMDSNTAIADTSYFMQPTPYSFGPHLFAQVNYHNADMRHGSLSQQQQVELMHSLETDGLSEIDNFMNLSQQYDTPIKFEAVKFGNSTKLAL